MILKASHSFSHSSVNICAVLIVPYNYLIYYEAMFKEQNAQRHTSIQSNSSRYKFMFQNQLLEAKVRKLEQLLRLKEHKIQVLSGKVPKHTGRA